MDGHRLTTYPDGCTDECWESSTAAGVTYITKVCEHGEEERGIVMHREEPMP